MFYLMVSILLAIFAPEIGVNTAESLRDFTTFGWHGFWFWLIGLFVYEVIAN